MNDDIIWLTQWFLTLCNGLWEDLYEVKLETTSDHGWGLSVDIADTELEEIKFTEIKAEDDNTNWIHCYVQGKVFHGYCSSSRMFEMIKIFRKWGEQYCIFTPVESPPGNSIEMLSWLNEWYVSQSHIPTLNKTLIKINTLENPGWNLKIDLKSIGLKLSDSIVHQMDRTKEDWYHCFIKDGIFYAPCGPFNLGEVIGIFRELICNVKK